MKFIHLLMNNLNNNNLFYFYYSLFLMIIKIEPSPLKNKRFRIFLSTNQHYDFGLKGGVTFIDHHDIDKRRNYWKRHLGNKIEKHLIENLVISPSLFSFYLLWGKFASLNDNIVWLDKLLEDKYHS